MPWSTWSFNALWASIGTSHVTECNGSSCLGWRWPENATVLQAAPGPFCQHGLWKDSPSHFHRGWLCVAAICSLSAPAPLVLAQRVYQRSEQPLLRILEVLDVVTCSTTWLTLKCCAESGFTTFQSERFVMIVVWVWFSMFLHIFLYHEKPLQTACVHELASVNFIFEANSLHFTNSIVSAA